MSIKTNENHILALMQFFNDGYGGYGHFYAIDSWGAAV